MDTVLFGAPKRKSIAPFAFHKKYFDFDTRLYLFEGHWYLCFGLLIAFPLDFKARVKALICELCHLHVMDSSDSPLVRHLPTLWLPSSWSLYWSLACATSTSFFVIRRNLLTTVRNSCWCAWGKLLFLHRIDYQLLNHLLWYMTTRREFKNKKKSSLPLAIWSLLN